MTGMRFRVFDGWRLVAACLIMLYHFLYHAPLGLKVPALALADRLTPLLDMFFMLSGFLIAARYGEEMRRPSDYVRFLRRRAARIYPLHLVTLGIFLCLLPLFALGIVSSGETGRWDLSALPSHLLAVHALGFNEALTFNYPSWSVSAELFCYVLFPLVLLAARRHGMAGLLALLAVWVAGLEAASAAGVFPQGHWLKTDTFGAWRAFAGFVFGAILFRLATRLAARVGARGMGHGPGLSVLALALAAMLLGLDARLAVLVLGLALVLSAAAEMSRPDSTRPLAAIERLGQASFGIYLWHPVMEALFLSLLWKRVIVPAEPGAATFLAFLVLPAAATVFVALLSSRHLEPRLGRLLAGKAEPSSGPRLAPA